MRKKILRILVLILGKLVVKFCRLLNYGGTALAGKIARKIYPQILEDISSGFYIIMITGTNGKTTTTKMIADTLKLSGVSYITNNSGANLLSGIVTTFMCNTKIFKTKRNKDIGGQPSAERIALLEVDEATFSVVTERIKPNVVIVTNFFRDQLDRYGELYSTLNKIRQGLQNVNDAKIILNADDSLCASLGAEAKNNVLYYGVDKECYNSEDQLTSSDAEFCIYCKNKYVYENRIYSHLGGFRCDKCGYSRPNSNVTCVKFRELTSEQSKICVSIDAENVCEMASLYITINIPGMYNIYNALAAISCSVLLNLNHEKIINALEVYQSGFGRMEVISAKNKTIKLVLVKNPTGFDQVLDLILMQQFNLQIAFLINDKILDGVDISWLWDVNFERLNAIEDKITKIYASGIRMEDMAVRLKYAGMNVNKIIMIKELEHLLDMISVNDECDDNNDNRIVYILATYTAMLQVRKILENKFNLKEFWK